MLIETETPKHRTREEWLETAVEYLRALFGAAEFTLPPQMVAGRSASRFTNEANILTGRFELGAVAAFSANGGVEQFVY